MFTKFRTFFKSLDDGMRSVVFDKAGLTIVSRREEVSVAWCDVLEVFAYKIDRFAVDDICIGLRFNEAGDYWWVSEEDVGYAALLEYLPKAFAGIHSDWFTDVALPAFVENRTTLWCAS